MKTTTGSARAGVRSAGKGRDVAARTSDSAGKFSMVINGREVVIEDLAPTTTLLDYLRTHGYTGTKCGCAEGDCGACSVALVDRDSAGKPTFRVINSCIALIPMFAAGRSSRWKALLRGDAAPGAGSHGGAIRLAVRVLHPGIRASPSSRPGIEPTATTPSSSATSSAATSAAAPAIGPFGMPRWRPWPSGTRRMASPTLSRAPGQARGAAFFPGLLRPGGAVLPTHDARRALFPAEDPSEGTARGRSHGDRRRHQQEVTRVPRADLHGRRSRSSPGSKRRRRNGGSAALPRSLL